jgi:hypothetical protein
MGMSYWNPVIEHHKQTGELLPEAHTLDPQLLDIRIHRLEQDIAVLHAVRAALPSTARREKPPRDKDAPCRWRAGTITRSYAYAKTAVDAAQVFAGIIARREYKYQGVIVSVSVGTYADGECQCAVVVGKKRWGEVRGEKRFAFAIEKTVNPL